MTERLVIAGGGHAAAQLCASLLDGKYAGHITLITDEAYLPYHRPPLSKTLIKDATAVLPELRGAAFYEQRGITLRLDQMVTTIDRAQKLITLQGTNKSSTGELHYDHLVLATGARVRPLGGVSPNTSGVFFLRTFDDAVALRNASADAQSVLVLGGGFIGLELAATLRALGKDVAVVEIAPRLLARAVSPEVSAHLLAAHQASGIAIHLDQTVESVVIEEGLFKALKLQNQILKADLLIVGIGSIPNTELAQAAGLACDNGIVVDDCLRTSDAAISAIGDCTSFHYPLWQQHVRLESVQNANEQARTVASRLCGLDKVHASMPWFWSDQGDIRLQITGLWRPGYRSEKVEGSKPGSFSVMHYDNIEGGELRAAESINAAPDHMAARKKLQASVSAGKTD